MRIFSAIGRGDRQACSLGNGAIVPSQLEDSYLLNTKTNLIALPPALGEVLQLQLCTALVCSARRASLVLTLAAKRLDSARSL
ncbi:uncharacterized protein L3040_005588 [Drepanopeziza brunnea f. sp. 'multigermtubi']|uniref:uncharacterized protein n=1 Tax=Drepanopeziza brunnea f. sp. 'multigermtubi' TaxID=698441 RepID=UPI0023984CE8|nr:hypothetical protein L3040_005588 [Drepanopeziza brunnea f. sp. 'multigermtubi']